MPELSLPFNEWIQVIHLFKLLTVFPAHAFVALTLKLAQEQFGTTQYFITLQKMWRSHLFPPRYDFSLFPKLWLFHSEEFRVVSLLCSHQADFSHKCRSVLHSFSSFVLILFCNYFPCSYWSSLFHTKKWKWQKQTWGVWRLAGVTSTGRQQCRNVLRAHVKHLLSSTHGASIGSDIIISL